MHCPKNTLHELVRFNNHPCMCMTACDVTHILEISIPIPRSITNNQVHSITSNQVGGSSLIPRPFHCPVFDNLQYAKTEGGALGAFDHVSDVNIYLGRQSGRGAL